MEKLKIIFLGTSASVPTKTRNHTSILLMYKGENILIDCGEGTQRQFRIANLNPCKITKILITHWHGDHFLGIPGLFQTLGMLGYSKTLKIYGPKGTKHHISIIKKLVNIEISLKVKEISNEKIFDNSDFYIESKSMLHNCPVNAYSFIIKDKRRIDKKKFLKYGLSNLPIIKNLQEGKNIVFNGKKIKSSSVTYIEKGRKVTFILDTIKNKMAFSLAKNSDLLIIESSFLSSEKEQSKKFKHLTLEDAIDIGKKSKSKKIVLVHISQRYPNLDFIRKKAKRHFNEISLAEDFDNIEI